MGKGWTSCFGLFLALSPPLFAQKPSLTFVASTADEALTFQAISKELAQRDIPIGTAYAVWTGIGAAGTFLVGVLYYGDSANALRPVSPCTRTTG